jgi:hypothetical protein
LEERLQRPARLDFAGLLSFAAANASQQGIAMLEDPIVRELLVRFAVKAAVPLLTYLVRKAVRYVRAKYRNQK